MEKRKTPSHTHGLRGPNELVRRRWGGGEHYSISRRARAGRGGTQGDRALGGTAVTLGTSDDDVGWGGRQLL